MLWAIQLVADRETKTRLDPKLNVGTFVRDWCWEHGMILRNNAEILVIAPSLTMTKEEMDIMLEKLDRAISAAMKHFGL